MKVFCFPGFAVTVDGDGAMERPQNNPQRREPRAEERKKEQPVLVELSPAAYLTLCGLVRDAMEVHSDALPILQNTANELMGATAGGMISSELAEQPACLEALRRGGFVTG